MAHTDISTQLADLFAEAKKDHLSAFIEVDGADPDWPIWYADYLHKRLTSLLKASFTRSELVYLLVLMAKEMDLHAPGAQWTHYYARFLLQRYPL